jgi:phosphoserine phosphatase
MTMVSAGHGPLLYYEAATGTVHSWDADDVPLGIMSGLEFDAPREVDFRPGDLLMLVTDGFFEWANAAGELFGTARLEAYVREHHADPPEVLIRGLHEAVLAHADGTEQGDDLTAVVIRRT